MTERDHEKKCQAELERVLPPPLFVWKIRDLTTGGQPDLEVNWHGATSKIEFKVLKGHEAIHDKWEDERQLITLVKYEQATGRAWVVAWRSKYKDFPAATYIYRPSALLHGRVPPAKAGDTPEKLWQHGVAWWPDVRYDVVAQLVRATHQ